MWSLIKNDAKELLDKTVRLKDFTTKLMAPKGEMPGRGGATLGGRGNIYNYYVLSNKDLLPRTGEST